MKLFKKFIEMLEVQGRYRTYTVLRGMSDNQLRDIGVSPESLSKGVKGWPWQAENDNELWFIPQNRFNLSPAVVTDVVQKPAAKTVTAADTQKSAA